MLRARFLHLIMKHAWSGILPTSGMSSGRANHYTTAPLILCYECSYLCARTFNANIEAVIHLSGIKPNCCSLNVTSPLNLIYVTLSTNLYGVTHQFDHMIVCDDPVKFSAIFLNSSVLPLVFIIHQLFAILFEHHRHNLTLLSASLISIMC